MRIIAIVLCIAFCSSATYGQRVQKDRGLNDSARVVFVGPGGSDIMSASDIRVAQRCDLVSFPVRSTSRSLLSDLCVLTRRALDVVVKGRAEELGVSPTDSAAVAEALGGRFVKKDHAGHIIGEYAVIELAFKGREYALAVRFRPNGKLIDVQKAEPFDSPR